LGTAAYRLAFLYFPAPLHVYVVARKASSARSVSRAAHSARISMPRRREVQFLRERARRLREMADEHQTALSDRLRMIAHELEAQADDGERGGGDGSPYPETEADR